MASSMQYDAPWMVVFCYVIPISIAFLLLKGTHTTSQTTNNNLSKFKANKFEINFTYCVPIKACSVILNMFLLNVTLVKTVVGMCMKIKALKIFNCSCFIG